MPCRPATAHSLIEQHRHSVLPVSVLQLSSSRIAMTSRAGAACQDLHLSAKRHTAKGSVGDEGNASRSRQLGEIFRENALHRNGLRDAKVKGRLYACNLQCLIAPCSSSRKEYWYMIHMHNAMKPQKPRTPSPPMHKCNVMEQSKIVKAYRRRKDKKGNVSHTRSLTGITIQRFLSPHLLPSPPLP